MNDSDLRIVETLIEAANGDRHPLLKASLPELLSMKERLQGGFEGGFAKWMKEHPEIHSEVMAAIEWKAVNFIEAQIDSLELKSIGGLTAEDKEIVKNVLSPLLERLERSFAPQNDNFQKAAQADQDDRSS